MQSPVLTVSQVAVELGVSPKSVRTTMNRRGYFEVRGYLRSDVDAVKATRLPKEAEK